ncbi:MAG: hypothetical protein AABZ06_14690 [Bdellovibrionota bacterium]
MSFSNTFIVCEYTPDLKTGVMKLVLPATAACKEKDEEHCDIKINGWRKRKTGPAHPLALVRCLVHKVLSIVYPPGFVPYARKKIDLSDQPSSLSWAAYEADRKNLWPKVSTKLSGVRWTQQVHIMRMLTMFGLNVNEGVRVKIGYILGTPSTLSLSSHLTLCAEPCRRATFGAALVAIFNEIPKTSDLFTKLLECGQIVGLWGRHVLWRHS